ncbi:MAG: ribosome recycling factor [Planctomycetota bacterium]
MTYKTVLDDGKGRFEKTLGHLKEQMHRIRTGRATTALVDGIRIDYYGTPTPINQLASVSIPEPRQIVIKPFDASVIKEIAKAILQSDLGTTPQNDGKILRLTLPPLSGEQREKYAAKVREICEEARVALRNGRRDMNKYSDGLARDGKLTEDENRKLRDEIQKLLKDYEGKVDEVMKKKVDEIQEV